METERGEGAGGDFCRHYCGYRPNRGTFQSAAAEVFITWYSTCVLAGINHKKDPTVAVDDGIGR